MPYIGSDPSNRFVAPKAASVFSGDGSTTAFTLDHAVGSDEDILVSVDGVIQEPSVAYAVSSGTTLTFTAAPSSNSGNNIFVYYLFRTVGTVSHPSNNALVATSGTFSDAITITTDGNNPQLSLVSTDADANAGPIIDLYRNSASPADGDLLGRIKFTGESSGTGIHTYGLIDMEINGVNDGNEQAKMMFKVSLPDGDLQNVLHVDRTEVCVNEDSEDIDFRVESDGNAYAFVVEASTGNIGVGEYTPAVSGKGIEIYNEGNDTLASIRLAGNNNTGTPGQKHNCELRFNGGGGSFQIIHYGSGDSVGTERARIDAAGDFYTNDGSVSSLSDSRVKKDITDLQDGLTIVNQLRPVTFKYNGASSMTPDDGKVNYGFIADEVQKVASHYVTENTDEINGEKVTDFKSLSTGRMIPMLFKAVQELSTEVETLKTKVAALESK